MSAYPHIEAPAPKKEYFTFAQLVQDREVEFPTLARAVRKTVPARDVAIEWTVGTEVWRNYQQIFRHPYRGAVPQGSSFQGGEDTAKKALVRFLQSVEQTLEHGVPSDERTGLRLPITTCGGYRHFLGRDLTDRDVLKLRPLREPFLWTHDWKFSPEHGWYALDTPQYEWLAEVSLQVEPGK